MDPTTLHAAVRRFPLVGRPRPACQSLPQRIKEITDIAATATSADADALHEGAHALNKAALLASDCGLPDLARDLCWQHINVYRQAGRPLTVLQARYMLEPALNLARLQIRADAGQHALRLLDAMYQATVNGTDLVIEDRRLPLAHLTGTPQQHHKLREWVWLQYLADGIRALTLAGRWDEAVTHARAHNGIGEHLMEGRQVEIITHLLHGDPHAAQGALEECTLTEPWEHLVGSCLSVMCTDKTSTSVKQSVTAMVERFLGSALLPGYAVFRTRLGLTVATLASSTDAEAAHHVHSQLVREVIECGDGYAARDLLTDSHPLSEMHKQALVCLMTSSELGAGELPDWLLVALAHSTKIATEALTATLRCD